MSGQSGAHQIVVGIIVATMANARRVTRKGRPNHPLEFKRRLAAVACDAAVSVAKLALEHGVNANLLFKWRRLSRGIQISPDMGIEYSPPRSRLGLFRSNEASLQLLFEPVRIAPDIQRDGVMQ